MPAASSSSSSSRLPLYLSLGIIGPLVAAYFLWPEFQAGVQDGWAVLRTGDQAQVAEWVAQFGYWGPVLVVVVMVAQMFLVVINNALLILVAVLVRAVVGRSAGLGRGAGGVECGLLAGAGAGRARGSAPARAEE